MPATLYPYYLANRAIFAPRGLRVDDKYTGGTLAHVPIADAETLTRAIAAGRRAAGALRAKAAESRRDALVLLADRVESRAREFAQVGSAETGRPVRAVREEVFRFAEALTTGEAPGRSTFGDRSLDPLLPWAFALPDGASMGLLGQIIAESLGSGTPLILCPTLRSPIVPLLLGSLMQSLHLPEGSFSILPAGSAVAAEVFSQSDLGCVGIPDRHHANDRHGGSTLVLADPRPLVVMADESVEASEVAAVYAAAAFEPRHYPLGPCFVAREQLANVRERVLDRSRRQVAGDPLLGTTTLAPAPSLECAERLRHWIDRALDAGATRLLGGDLQGVRIPATILELPESRRPFEAPPPGCPVGILQGFSSAPAALRQAAEMGDDVRLMLLSDDLGPLRLALETPGLSVQRTTRASRARPLRFVPETLATNEARA